MRLGIVVPGGFDPEPDVATIPVLRALAQELATRHKVEVFASAGRRPCRYRLGAVGVTQLGPRATAFDRRRLRAARLAIAFARWVREAGPFDVLHAFWADRTALIAVIFGHAASVPSVVSIAGGELAWLPDIPYGGAGALRSRAVTRAALGLAGAITAGSPFVARMLSSALAARVRIVPLGVDVARFAGPVARLPGPPWRLLHVANLNEVKDQWTLLRAFRKVLDQLGDVRLDCVGEDALAGAVQRYARSLGLEDRVSFHGFVHPERLGAFYRRAHLHVLSSRHESEGVVVLEAAAAGIPTVGTKVGLLDMFAPKAACAVPVGDAGALADAICAVLMDTSARESLGAAAQGFAREHDVVWTARTFEAIYAQSRPDWRRQTARRSPTTSIRAIRW